MENGQRWEVYRDGEGDVGERAMWNREKGKTYGKHRNGETDDGRLAE